MSERGWIYLRVDKDRGYCIGQTNSLKRRDKEYRKENPWIKKVDAYEVEDTDQVEATLIQLL